ncbi:MAG: hypothetical protein AAFN41_08005 [Planctomycetota bacterium]
MGTLGPEIFGNDLALDVQGSLVAMYEDGVAARSAEARLLDEFEPLDDEDYADFWLAVAAVEAEHGRLTKRAKSRALGVIGSGAGAERWRREAPEHLDARAAALRALEALLRGPKRKRTVFGARTEASPAVCEAGDVIALQIDPGRWVALGVSEVPVDSGISKGPAYVVEVLDVESANVPELSVCLEALVRADRWCAAKVAEEEAAFDELLARYKPERIEWARERFRPQHDAWIADTILRHSAMCFVVEPSEADAIVRLGPGYRPRREPTQGLDVGFVGGVADLVRCLRQDFLSA